MPYQERDRDSHFANDGQPKRILALDGGGLRGILTVAILQKIEDILRKRYGNSDSFRLCHYFDLIAGTSTGAIIAAALAQGWTVEQVRKKYMILGSKVFKKSLLRKGFVRAKYDEHKLIKELKSVYGTHTTLGSSKMQTGLLVVTKRLDTGSPWPISNNPKGKYFASRKGGTIGNGDYPLWQVVRASTAAPGYFDGETISIKKNGYKTVEGNFVDGGVSPFNNPALAAFMYTTMDGYLIGWPTGADNILLVSVGTGSADPSVKRSAIAAKEGVGALLSIMDDSAALQETILQWLSSSPTVRTIDREQEDLQNDILGEAPLLSYLRYNVDLSTESVQTLDPKLTDKKKIKALSSMDAPKNMKILHRLGELAATDDVQEDHFPPQFDLPEDENMRTRHRYRKKTDQSVIAVQLNLNTDGFTYHKWGGEQRCKQGDWLVSTQCDIHTVDSEVFARTYREVDGGRYVKIAPIWAEMATDDGSISTKEGISNYKAGDFLVSNNEDGSDEYCISAGKFETMYEVDE